MIRRTGEPQFMHDHVFKKPDNRIAKIIVKIIQLLKQDRKM